MLQEAPHRLSEAQYTTAVIKETLRMFPVGFSIRQDDKELGFTLFLFCFAFWGVSRRANSSPGDLKQRVSHLQWPHLPDRQHGGLPRLAHHSLRPRQLPLAEQIPARALARRLGGCAGAAKRLAAV